MRLFEEGTQISDTYFVERFLGEGAFAEVYRVKHSFLGRRQAMKVFKVPGMTREAIGAVLKEATLLSELEERSRNIVRVYEANTIETKIGRCAFFTMECVAGGTLFDRWKSYGREFMPIEESIDLIRQACSGLSVAHSQKPPIIHRDIKPQNLLVGYDPDGLRLRVSDFGLAKRVNPLTLLASANGTIAFKAPEVFRDPQADSREGDVWALGCVLYLLLTDRLPYQNVSAEQRARGDFSGDDFVVPSVMNKASDKALDKIVAKALAPKPALRIANAKELLAALNRWEPPRDETSGAFGLSSPVLSDSPKEALGPASEPDEKRAMALVDQAWRVAASPGKLTEAADLLEEAVRRLPRLREQFSFQIQLWRRGVPM